MIFEYYVTVVHSSAMIQQHIILTKENSIDLYSVVLYTLKSETIFEWLVNLTCLHLSFQRCITNASSFYASYEVNYVKYTLLNHRSLK